MGILIFFLNFRVNFGKFINFFEVYIYISVYIVVYEKNNLNVEYDIVFLKLLKYLVFIN